MVFTHAHILTGVMYGTPLAYDDVARLCELTAEQFDAESLAFGLTAVLRTTYTFFVCHDASVFKGLCNDFFHEDLGEELAVSVALLVSGATFLFEDQNLVILQMLEDLALYCGAFNYRCADFDLTVIVCEQDFVETYGRILFALETVNIKFPTFSALNC